MKPVQRGDRGRRDLPVRPGFLGEDLPTRRTEMLGLAGSGARCGA
ncbi:MAG TPA: hypothetical protein VME46_21275 [Acidimicrobiales bacterium]|nr:hypothetical protein [Acidimicrobiales bacterium]